MRIPLPHLLGYLADGRYLSVEELDRIQDHIRDRKNRLLVSKGLPPDPSPDELLNASKFRHSAIQSKILNMMTPGELAAASSKTHPSVPETSAHKGAGLRLD